MTREMVETAIALLGRALFCGSMAYGTFACFRLLRSGNKRRFEVRWMRTYYPRMCWGALIGNVLFALGRWLID